MIEVRDGKVRTICLLNLSINPLGFLLQFPHPIGELLNLILILRLLLKQSLRLELSLFQRKIKVNTIGYCCKQWLSTCDLWDSLPRPVSSVLLSSVGNLRLGWTLKLSCIYNIGPLGSDGPLGLTFQGLMDPWVQTRPWVGWTLGFRLNPGDDPWWPLLWSEIWGSAILSWQSSISILNYCNSLTSGYLLSMGSS